MKFPRIRPEYVAGVVLLLWLALVADVWVSARAAPKSASVASNAVQLLNVSYDPTRELYRDVNKEFAKEWLAKTGQTVGVRQSHGSGKRLREQTRCANDLLKIRHPNGVSIAGVSLRFSRASGRTTS